MIISTGIPLWVIGWDRSNTDRRQSSHPWYLVNSAMGRSQSSFVRFVVPSSILAVAARKSWWLHVVHHGAMHHLSFCTVAMASMKRLSKLLFLSAIKRVASQKAYFSTVRKPPIAIFHSRVTNRPTTVNPDLFTANRNHLAVERWPQPMPPASLALRLPHDRGELPRSTNPRKLCG